MPVGNKEYHTYRYFAIQKTAIRPEIEAADFETRPRIIKMLDGEVMLTIGDEQKIVYVRCAIGEESALDCGAYNVFWSVRSGDCCQERDLR